MARGADGEVGGGRSRRRRRRRLRLRLEEALAVLPTSWSRWCWLEATHGMVSGGGTAHVLRQLAAQGDRGGAAARMGEGGLQQLMPRWYGAVAR